MIRECWEFHLSLIAVPHAKEQMCKMSKQIVISVIHAEVPWGKTQEEGAS